MRTRRTSYTYLSGTKLCIFALHCFLLILCHVISDCLSAPRTPSCLLLLLLLLSHFSRVQLCATPETAAHQAPPSLGFARQEHWSGCHCLLQCMKEKSESEVSQSRPTLSDPMDCSPPGSPVPGILQAGALEWVPSPSPRLLTSALHHLSSGTLVISS